MWRGAGVCRPLPRSSTAITCRCECLSKVRAGQIPQLPNNNVDQATPQILESPPQDALAATVDGVPAEMRIFPKKSEASIVPKVQLTFDAAPLHAYGDRICDRQRRGIRLGRDFHPLSMGSPARLCLGETT
jgi:hypothetical protein